MPIAKEKLELILKQNFPNSTITITSLVDDDDHYCVEIVDQVFVGKTKVQQHKMVNQALEGIIGTELHAMQLKTSS